MRTKELSKVQIIYPWGMSGFPNLEIGDENKEAKKGIDEKEKK